MPNKQLFIGTTSHQQALFLFIDWLGALLSKKFGPLSSSSNSSNSWTFIFKGNDCKVERDEATGRVYVETPEHLATEVFALANDALQKTIAVDLGEPSWWTTSLHSQSGLTEASLLHSMRSLSQHKRFKGDWRLGGDALLRFTQETEDPLSFPNQHINITFRSTGPDHGPFSKPLAQEALNQIRTAIVFATGAPLHGFSMIWAAKEEERAEAQALLAQPSVPELHADGLPLWPALAALLTPDNQEAFDRVIGAMLAYEHGLEQKTDPAAIIFFVTAIEALSVPHASWSNKRVTKRFQEFLLTACPEAVENTMRHPNFVQVFGRFKKPEDFISKLYKLRSHPVHTGQLGNYTGFAHTDPTIRIMLVSEVTKNAISAFIHRPFSLLWGHPEIDPAVELKFSPKEYTLLKKRAKRAKKGVAEWIRLVALAKAKEDLKPSRDN
jgi:hypothetical protein